MESQNQQILPIEIEPVASTDENWDNVSFFFSQVDDNLILKINILNNSGS